MAKDKPQMDNLTLLAGRQGVVGDKVLGAANVPGGMDAEAWAKFLNFDIPETIVTSPSERTRKAVETLTRTGGYGVPENLLELFWMLFDDFAASRQEYVRRGWTTLEPDAPEVKSSMTQPLEAEAVMGPLIQKENEDDE
ncbi:MAG: hypothetical protein ABIJ47_01345 [Candidatus Bathyarchaeota archaeon]